MMHLPFNDQLNSLNCLFSRLKPKGIDLNVNQLWQVVGSILSPGRKSEEWGICMMYLSSQNEPISTRVSEFIEVIRRRLSECNTGKPNLDDSASSSRESAVLIPLTAIGSKRRNASHEMTIIMNKRSDRVRQPGDWCYPGGGVLSYDRILSKVIYYRQFLKKINYKKNRTLDYKINSKGAVFLAAAMREAWEEMRLNPFRLSYIGAIAPERLVLFDHLIHPLVVWTNPIQNFRPNWEVERIIQIPLAALLDKSRYGRFRPKFDSGGKPGPEFFPCFFLGEDDPNEVLWGVSYRITMRFLKSAFGFEPPPVDRLPLIEKQLHASYLRGSLWARHTELD
jgi:8-oxo-dGTP pyrophosphatase MutT (NUDIX family)